MNNLKDIHNSPLDFQPCGQLFYQDFNEQFEGYTQHEMKKQCVQQCCFIRISMNNLKDIHNTFTFLDFIIRLFYQDFNEQFEGYTQLSLQNIIILYRCFIRISMNNLKDIHNQLKHLQQFLRLFYQDFNEQFEGHTQRVSREGIIDRVVLSGFQ